MIAKNNPNRIAGSAEGAVPEGASATFVFNGTKGKGDGESSSEALTRHSQEGGMPTDGINTVLAEKFVDTGRNIEYIANGLLSLVKDTGKFLVSSDSNQSKKAALIMDPGRSSTTTTNRELKLGTPQIKFLTGLVSNPSGSTIPSSAVTPNKTWLPTWFPVFIEIDFAGFTTMQLMKVLLFTAMASLKENGLKKEDSTNNNDLTLSNDLPTQIIDNQDIEAKILNGTMGV